MTTSAQPTAVGHHYRGDGKLYVHVSAGMKHGEGAGDVFDVITPTSGPGLTCLRSACISSPTRGRECAHVRAAADYMAEGRHLTAPAPPGAEPEAAAPAQTVPGTSPGLSTDVPGTVPADAPTRRARRARGGRRE